MRSFFRRRGIQCFGRRVSETSTIVCDREDSSINEASLGTPTGSGASLLVETKRKGLFLSRGSIALGVVGVLMILTAYLIYALDPFNLIINHTLALYEGSYAYGLWKKPPVPVYLRVYVFNVTNSEAFLRGEERLKVEELGPYVYREILENANATFGIGDDDTVTFDPKRTVHWEADMSKGSLQDRIIVPNIPLIGLSSLLSEYSIWTNMAFSALTNYLSTKPFLELSVEEYLWGHQEPLLELASKVLPTWISFSSLGLLDRLFNMGSGNITVNDGRINYKDKYLIEKVNNAPTLGRWSWEEPPEPDEIELYEACERRDTVNGTYEGMMFPQGIERNMSLRMFRDAFCRSIYLTYTKDVVVGDTFSAFRFQPPYGVLNQSDPENACLCVNDEENCLPSGLSDISPCFFGIPAALSFPHHYQSDPRLREEVLGFFPVKEKHETYMDIQPVIGVPLEAHSRIQVNIVVRDTKRIRKAAPFSNLIVPIIWTDLSLDGLPPDILSTVHLLLVTTPILQKGAILGLSCMGAAMILAGLLLACCSWVERQNKFNEETATMKRWYQKPIITSYDNAKKYVPMAVIQAMNDTADDELQKNLWEENSSAENYIGERDHICDLSLLKNVIPMSLQSNNI